MLYPVLDYHKKYLRKSYGKATKSLLNGPLLSDTALPGKVRLFFFNWIMAMGDLVFSDITVPGDLSCHLDL
jgi:hypothetical protein